MSFLPTPEMSAVLAASARLNKYAHCDECGYLECPDACKRGGNCYENAMDAYEELKEAITDDIRYQTTGTSNIRARQRQVRQAKIQASAAEIAAIENEIAAIFAEVVDANGQTVLPVTPDRLSPRTRRQVRDLENKIGELKSSISTHTRILEKEEAHRKRFIHKD